jgi:hypothetical protein
VTAPGIVIRWAAPRDGGALARLAALDSDACLPGPLLVAEVEGEIRAALALGDRGAIADPFHRTAELVELLRLRASQLAAPREASRRRAGGLGEWSRRPRPVATDIA